MKLRWTHLARAGVDAAYEYVTIDSVIAADQFLERIRQATDVLIRHPMAGRTGRIAGTRELVLAGTPWIVAYHVRRGFTDILAVLHGARKWSDNF